MDDATEEPLISQAEAAKRLGVNRSTIYRQIQDGALRAYGTKVRFSEVVADRAANIDPTRSPRRKDALQKPATKAGATQAAKSPGAPRSRGTKADNQARRAAADAEMREMDLAERRGQLTVTAEVGQAASDAIALMTSAFERAIETRAATAGARHGWDERKMRLELKAFMSTGLEAFNDAILKRLDARERARMPEPDALRAALAHARALVATLEAALSEADGAVPGPPQSCDGLDLVTPGEAAFRVGRDESTVRRWAREGLGLRRSGRWLISLRDARARANLPE